MTPPRPREEVFPPLRLLLGLVEKTPTPAKTPWPLLALRLLVAAAVVLAMAGPIWNAIVARAGAGSLLVILDDSWAAAPTWGARVIAAREARPDAWSRLRRSRRVARRSGRSTQKALNRNSSRSRQIPTRRIKRRC